jgi:N-acetylglucosamine-6-phosphate deacetylase
MIQPDCICSPSEEVWEDILGICDNTLRMMTIAPELPEAGLMIQRCLNSGAVPSFGHSEASYEETRKGFEQGISHVTHLFNAMLSLHHREPGPLAAIAEHSSCTVQLISDGVHIHKALIPLVYRALESRRIALITDGMQAMGLPEGAYVYNGIPYRSEGGAARYHDGTLIGTSLGLNDILKRFMAFTGCSLSEALETVTSVPAGILGISDRTGLIREGMNADILFIDNELQIKGVVAGGELRLQDETVVENK